MDRKQMVRKSLPVLIVLGGILVAIVLLLTRPQPARTTPATEAVPVQVQAAEPARERIRVTAMGTVLPARQVSIQPQVGGRIVEVGPNLVPGGRLEAGDLLVRIDPRDYELAIESRMADVERVKFELEIEAGQRRIAEREWELLGKSVPTTEQGRSLALREPHLRNLRAALEAARSGLEKARLDLDRTRIVAPFNAIVQEELAEVGQTVTPQSKLAKLIGSDELWVRLSLPVADLRWIRFPDGGSEASRVTVIHETGSDPAYRHSGTVLRLYGDLEPAGRLARVLVSVPDPGKAFGASGAATLFVGAYVRAEIEGPEIENVFVVPRSALHDGDELWLMNDDNRLEVRPVEIAWRGIDTIFVKDGISAGERIVTSRIAAPLPRMALREMSEPPAKTAAADDEKGEIR